MPPQAGVFALPYKASRSADALNGIQDVNMSYNIARSPVLTDEPTKLAKDKKRREIASKLGKDLADHRRDETFSRYSDALVAHQKAFHQLATASHTRAEYTLALYPRSLERTARLRQVTLDEDYALECANLAWEEERTRVEDEWRKGRERIRDRMLQGIEDRRKRAREDKDGEGTVVDSSLDAQSRPHLTRKLRNKIPPTHATGGARSPSPLSTPNAALPTHSNAVSLTNPYSLALDTLPSPFPLALPLKEPPPRRGGKQTASSQQFQSNGLGNGRVGNGDSSQLSAAGTGAAMGLGKSLAGLTGARDIDVEGDLTELRRGARRKRARA